MPANWLSAITGPGTQTEDYSHHTAVAQRRLDQLNRQLADGKIEEAHELAEEVIDRMRGVIAYCEAKQSVST